MTTLQKIIKYAAMAFAVFLIVSIISGILGAVGLLGLFGETNAVAKEITAYPVSDQITSLELEIGAAELTVYQADKLTVESNLKNLKVEEKDGTLVIRETSNFAKNYNGAVLKLGIPESVLLKNADLKTGAGQVKVETLRAEKLSMELGAGEVQISRLETTAETKIEGGAGKITVSSGSLQNLDLDMGVGQMNLTCALLGNSDLDLGVGETNLVLLGAEGDYRIEMEKGIGSMTVNGNSMENGATYGSGPNNIDIEGGVGAVKISFQA